MEFWWQPNLFEMGDTAENEKYGKNFHTAVSFCMEWKFELLLFDTWIRSGEMGGRYFETTMVKV